MLRSSNTTIPWGKTTLAIASLILGLATCAAGLEIPSECLPGLAGGCSTALDSGGPGSEGPVLSNEDLFKLVMETYRNIQGMLRDLPERGAEERREECEEERRRADEDLAEIDPRAVLLKGKSEVKRAPAAWDLRRLEDMEAEVERGEEDLRGIEERLGKMDGGRPQLGSSTPRLAVSKEAYQMALKSQLESLRNALERDRKVDPKGGGGIDPGFFVNRNSGGFFGTPPPAPQLPPQLDPYSGAYSGYGFGVSQPYPGLPSPMGKAGGLPSLADLAVAQPRPAAREQPSPSENWPYLGYYSQPAPQPAARDAFRPPSFNGPSYFRPEPEPAFRASSAPLVPSFRQPVSPLPFNLGRDDIKNMEKFQMSILSYPSHMIYQQPSMGLPNNFKSPA